MKKLDKTIHRRKRRKPSKRSKNRGEEEDLKTSSRSRSPTVAMNYDADTVVEDMEATHHRRKRRKSTQSSKNSSLSAANDYHVDTDCEDANATHRRKRRKVSQSGKSTNDEAEHSNALSLSAANDYYADSDFEDVAVPSAAAGDKSEVTFKIDLSDVPPQPLICKSAASVKEGASKYTNVYFDKNRWRVMITIDSEKYHVGYYDSEEEAAADYARAVFKYKGNDKARRRKSSGFVIDLSDVPRQSPIPNTRKGPTKYKGAYFDNTKGRWVASILIDGRQRYIGSYVNEEEAASDYAGAVFKYKGSFRSKGKDRQRRAPETNSSRLPPRTRSCRAGLTAASSNDTYEVEEIVGYRCNNGEVEYLIKWFGYSEEENSWEPEANLNEASLAEATAYREARETC